MMSFHLRVVSGEEICEGRESETGYVRRVMSLLSGARLDFRHCLNVCHEQKLSTPQYGLWDFARENRPFFERFFSLAISDKESERGIELVNQLIMIVYLRKVEQLAYLNAPILAWSVFALSNNTDCQRQLLQEATVLAEKCVFPQTADQDRQRRDIDQGTERFRKKLRNALG